MLIIDEIVYAANRDLLRPRGRPRPDRVEARENLELVLTGGHERPEYLVDRVDLVSNVRKEKHPLENGHPARKGTEYQP